MLVTETNLALATQSIRAAFDASSGVKVDHVESVDIVNSGDGMQALEKGKNP